MRIELRLCRPSIALFMSNFAKGVSTQLVVAFKDNVRIWLSRLWQIAVVSAQVSPNSSPERLASIDLRPIETVTGGFDLKG